jgi:hypothetical protein
MTPVDITYCLIALGVIVWLSVLAVVVGACMSAALGDRAQRTSSRDPEPVARRAPARMRVGV